MKDENVSASDSSFILPLSSFRRLTLTVTFAYCHNVLTPQGSLRSPWGLRGKGSS